MTLLDQTRETLRDLVPGRGGNEMEQAQRRRPNVGPDERTVSLAAGAILAALGLSRRSVPGMLIAGVGGAMIYRGATGHCHLYDALGIDTHGPEGAESQAAIRGIHVEQALLINKPAEELYRFWRDFENLPKIMEHLESVRVTGERTSHWVAKPITFAGRIEWDAEILRDDPNSRIAWRSLPGSDIDTTGEIRFQKAVADRGTEVHVFMDYVPPAGQLAHWVAKLSGHDPSRVVREDLRNFKRLMELGSIPTILGQPHGTCTGQGKRYTESQWKPLFT